MKKSGLVALHLKSKTMKTPETNYLEINRELWNKLTDYHVESDFYKLEQFTNGENVLMPIELEQVGDVQGKSLLHLQCHFGLDSLSWARLGAQVTGIDLSDKAIETAQHLAQELEIDARFICCDLYSLPEHLDEQFDIVFTSYGTISWLPDLERWAEVVARFLKPGGAFHFVEFHPVIWMFDDDFKKIDYSYFNCGPIAEEMEGSYVNRAAPIRSMSIGWNHSIADVLSALLRVGLRIEHFAEYDWSPYNCFNNTVEIDANKWQIEGLEGKLPMVYALKAAK